MKFLNAIPTFIAGSNLPTKLWKFLSKIPPSHDLPSNICPRSISSFSRSQMTAWWSWKNAKDRHSFLHIGFEWDLKVHSADWTCLHQRNCQQSSWSWVEEISRQQEEEQKEEEMIFGTRFNYPPSAWNQAFVAVIYNSSKSDMVININHQRNWTGYLFTSSC